MAHAVARTPPNATRALGLAGILGGLVLVAAFVVSPGLGLNIVRLVVFSLGAIAVIVGVHRWQAPAGRNLSLAAAIPAIAANAWFLAMVMLSIGRPQPPAADVDFRLVAFYADVALWLTDAAFALVALRLGVVQRWAALALAVGSIVAIAGIDRLGLVTGAYGSIVSVLAQTGVALAGLGWILLGIGLVTSRPGVDRGAAESPPAR